MTEADHQVLTVAILGGGSFGTALANIIARNGHDARLWVRDEVRARECQQSRENAHYLPGFKLHEKLIISADLKRCIAGARVVVIAVPSESFREVAKTVSPLLPQNTIVISATKGVEHDGFVLMSQILEQELPDNDIAIGVLSGPNFAKEIVQNQFTGSVIASEYSEVLEQVPRIFSSSTFRVYTNSDRYGVELAGALKNIYAIVTGIARALGCGNNTIAMLLTRSLAEMSRFAKCLGANSMTFLGLTGVGDLILTCTSDLSRNYRVGYAIGSGTSLEQAMADIGQVVEGVNTLKIVKAKAEELDVYMPLAMGLHAVLFEKRDIKTIIAELMSGENTTDVEYDR